MSPARPVRGITFDYKRFGSKLKQARRREGFRTVDELSEYLAACGIHISSRTLRRYEQGTHSPSCEVLAALLKALPSDHGSFYTDSIAESERTRYTAARLDAL